MADFSERIRELRTKYNISQEALGAVIGVKKYAIYSYEKGRASPEMGVKKYAIYSYEKGRASPEMKGLIGLADYFGVSIDYLVGRTDNPEINR